MERRVVASDVAVAAGETVEPGGSRLCRSIRIRRPLSNREVVRSRSPLRRASPLNRSLSHGPPRPTRLAPECNPPPGGAHRAGGGAVALLADSVARRGQCAGPCVRVRMGCTRVRAMPASRLLESPTPTSIRRGDMNAAKKILDELPAENATSEQFRFYDNRQKYLAFVNTCNEKSAVARRVAQELTHIRPQPPALRIFDAGMGDATVLTQVMRNVHRMFPWVPLLAVAKEISLEDVRLGLEKMPDRFFEHPATVLAITNLNYADAPRLMLKEAQMASALNWQEVKLVGTSAHEYAEQIEELSSTLAYGWQTRVSENSGN